MSMEEYKRLIELIRYGSEDELEKALIDFINKYWGKSEDSVRAIRRLFYGIRFEPRRRVKKAFLRAIAETGIWDKEILDAVFSIARDDPEPEVKELAEKAALEALKKVDNKNKKEALIFLLRAIDRRLIYLSPMDIIKVVGANYARELLNDESLSYNIKDLINFALKNIENEKQ